MGCITHIVQGGNAGHTKTADHDLLVFDAYGQPEHQQHREQTEGYDKGALNTVFRHRIKNLQDNRTEKLQYEYGYICFKRKHISLTSASYLLVNFRNSGNSSFTAATVVSTSLKVVNLEKLKRSVASSRSFRKPMACSVAEISGL